MELSRCLKGHMYFSSKKDCPYCSKKKDTEKILVEEVEETKTVAYIEEDVEPVVGWLVCIDGYEKGKDYKLKDERNFIGSSIDEDVCIQGDDKIVSDNHFSITYNSKQRVFVISPGVSGSLIYLNKKPVYETQTLESFSLIELSKTKLVFVQFCGNNFSWE